MTSIEQLKEKHFYVLDGGYIEVSECEKYSNQHSNISIQFAIECLEPFVNYITYSAITNKIEELKQQIK